MARLSEAATKEIEDLLREALESSMSDSDILAKAKEIAANHMSKSGLSESKYVDFSSNPEILDDTAKLRYILSFTRPDLSNVGGVVEEAKSLKFINPKVGTAVLELEKAQKSGNKKLIAAAIASLTALIAFGVEMNRKKESVEAPAVSRFVSQYQRVRTGGRRLAEKSPHFPLPKQYDTPENQKAMHKAKEEGEAAGKKIGKDVGAAAAVVGGVEVARRGVNKALKSDSVKGAAREFRSGQLSHHDGGATNSAASKAGKAFEGARSKSMETANKIQIAGEGAAAKAKDHLGRAQANLSKLPGQAKSAVDSAKGALQSGAEKTKSAAQGAAKDFGQGRMAGKEYGINTPKGSGAAAHAGNAVGKVERAASAGAGKVSSGVNKVAGAVSSAASTVKTAASDFHTGTKLGGINLHGAGSKAMSAGQKIAGFAAEHPGAMKAGKVGLGLIGAAALASSAVKALRDKGNQDPSDDDIHGEMKTQHERSQGTSAEPSHNPGDKVPAGYKMVFGHLRKKSTATA